MWKQIIVHNMTNSSCSYVHLSLQDQAKEEAAAAIRYGQNFCATKCEERDRDRERIARNAIAYNIFLQILDYAESLVVKVESIIQCGSLIQFVLFALFAYPFLGHHQCHLLLLLPP